MKKADLMIIAVLLVIALGVFGASKLIFNKSYKNKYVEIYVQNKLIQKIQIPDSTFKKTIEISTKLGKNIVVIENNGVRMTDADCFDKICVKDGFKDKNGDTIVCLPHKVVVEIKGEDEVEADGVAY